MYHFAPFSVCRIILATLKARQRRKAEGRAPTPSEVKARTPSTPEKKTPQKKTPQEKTPQRKTPQKNFFHKVARRNKKRGRRGPGLRTHTLGNAFSTPAGSDSVGRGKNTAQTPLFRPSHNAQMKNCGNWVES